MVRDLFETMVMLSRLFRWRLSLMNGAAAVAGLLLFPRVPTPAKLSLLFLGASLMAAGGSALNQYLERDLDRLMRRTENRPLPKGELRPVTVAAAGCVLALSGSLLLWRVFGPFPAFLGGATLFWYLGVYTPLKRRVPVALLLGAVCGGIPPLMGWSAAGGGLAALPPLYLALLMYLWQVPHFWLLQHRHADDYRRAGIPLFDPAARGMNPAPFFLLWTLALVSAALMLPAFGLLGSASAVCLPVLCGPLIFALRRRFEPAFFAYLNVFPLLIAAALWLGNRN